MHAPFAVVPIGIGPALRLNRKEPPVATWIKIRATPEQRAAWYEKARLKGVTFSELVRQSLDGVRVQRRNQLRRVEPALLRQLARVGNNLNQLARWANRDQRYVESAQVLARLIEIDRELAELRAMYAAPVAAEGSTRLVGPSGGASAAPTRDVPEAPQ